MVSFASAQDRAGGGGANTFPQSARGLWASLWQQHVCLPPDGVTAQQRFMYYSHNTDFPRQVRLSNGTFEWYCIAGIRWTPVGWRSYCQPILEIPGAPMFPGNTGWRAFNTWILGRVLGAVLDASVRRRTGGIRLKPRRPHGPAALFLA